MEVVGLWTIGIHSYSWHMSTKNTLRRHISTQGGEEKICKELGHYGADNLAEARWQRWSFCAVSWSGWWDTGDLAEEWEKLWTPPKGVENVAQHTNQWQTMTSWAQKNQRQVSLNVLYCKKKRQLKTSCHLSDHICRVSHLHFQHSCI